ncbi:MAG: hypothetical protein KDB27_23485 [Planctomycetales bacterium]|nr:hypothetical protein [Planctomycetales bacterium]
MKKLFLLFGLCAALFVGCQKPADTAGDAAPATPEVETGADDLTDDADATADDTEEDTSGDEADDATQ